MVPWECPRRNGTRHRNQAASACSSRNRRAPAAYVACKKAKQPQAQAASLDIPPGMNCIDVQKVISRQCVVEKDVAVEAVAHQSVPMHLAEKMTFSLHHAFTYFPLGS